MDEERLRAVRYKEFFENGTDPYVYPNVIPYGLRYYQA